MDMALDILKRLNTTGINAEQLASAKAYTEGLYPTSQLETADQLESVLGDIELYGLNRGEVDDLFSRIDAVTLERANAVAKKWYGQDQLTFVILGNASGIRDVVKKYAPDKGSLRERSRVLNHRPGRQRLYQRSSGSARTSARKPRKWTGTSTRPQTGSDWLARGRVRFSN